MKNIIIIAVILINIISYNLSKNADKEEMSIAITNNDESTIIFARNYFSIEEKAIELIDIYNELPLMGEYI